MSRRPRRHFTDEYKTEVVELVRMSGKSPGQIAKDLDLTETALREWVAKAKGEAPRKEGPVGEDERAELNRLREENRVLKMERDFLKKTIGRAASCCARNSEARTVAVPARSDRQLFGAKEPDKKHGPGVAAYLRVVTP